MLNVPVPKKMIDTPTSRPMSPVRVVKNALSAARAFGYSSHQCPISMNEHRPMISQPRIIWIVLTDVTSVSIPQVKRLSPA